MTKKSNKTCPNRQNKKHEVENKNSLKESLATLLKCQKELQELRLKLHSFWIGPYEEGIQFFSSCDEKLELIKEELKPLPIHIFEEELEKAQENFYKINTPLSTEYYEFCNIYLDDDLADSLDSSLDVDFSSMRKGAPQTQRVYFKSYYILLDIKINEYLNGINFVLSTPSSLS